MLVTTKLWLRRLSLAWKKLFFLIWLLILLSGMSGPAAAQDDASEILILNSYHHGFDWSDNEIQGILAALPADTTAAIEYMDTKRLASEEYFDLLYETYQQKYEHTTFDAIVALDNNAFDFMLEHRANLFPGTPLVFGGVNHFEDAMIAGQKQVTGVTETINHNATIDIALKLHPDTKRLLLITDQTTTGQTHREYLEQLDRENKFPVEFVFLDQGDGLDVPQLLQIVSNAPANSVIYYSDFFRDKHGNLINYQEVLPRLSQAATAPIYNTGDFYLNYGTVGGKLVSGYYEGKAAGEMVSRILAGEPVSDIPLKREGVTQYMFDYEQLARWQIPLAALPEGSIVVNTPNTFYYRYKEYIWGGVTFVLGQTLIIAFLIFNMVRRKKAENSLREYSEHLEDMVDERTQKLRQTQEQLVQQEKLATLGQLASSMAHELHNPLGGIKNTTYYLNMMLENSSPDIKESLDILNQEVMNSKHIINSLLEFTHPEPAITRWIDINEILLNVIARRTIPDHITLLNQLSTSPLLVEVDPEHMETIFNNLIHNAIQAMSPPIWQGGQLIIESKTVDEWGMVSIKDTGVGIGPESQNKLFEPLFTTKAKGIGLGLALSKILIEENNGIINVKSEGVPGRGSEFTIRLPLVRHPQIDT